MERSISTKKSIKIAKKYLKKFGIIYKIERFKTNRFSSIFVSGKKKNENFYSSGKGIGKKYIASGLFELLEHYFFANERFNKIKLCEFPNLVKIVDGCDYPLKMIKNIKDKKFDFFEMQNILSKEKSFYPSFLSYELSLEKLDDVKDFRLKQYFTNSGISVGISYKEAFIHSFLEIFERHAVSMFILENFYLKNLKFENYIINFNSLIETHKNIFEAIFMLTNVKPIIFDITKFTKIPTFMVVVKNNHSIHPFMGSGASLDSNYALERALLECLQLIHVYNTEEFESEKGSLAFNEKFPLFHKIFKFEYEERNNKIIDYQTIKFDNKVNEIYTFLLDYLVKNKYDAYEKILYKNKRICCIQLTVLGISKLNTTFNGSFMIPTDEEIKKWRVNI